MTPREERGALIAATQKIIRKGKVWLVPSQSGRGKYTVCPDEDCPFCNCPDFEETGLPCKHVFASRFTIKREEEEDGSVTETCTMTLTAKRKTYPQDWEKYNLAQTTEKKRFHVLLRDLCAGIEEPPPPKCGRRPAPIADVVFACVAKVYSGVSNRRFGTDLAEAVEKGFMSESIHPMSICAFLQNEALTPILHRLIAESAAPLRVVETDFAADSTGFSTNRFIKWIDQKYGCPRQEHDWVKVHVAAGTKTHVVTAVTILDRDAGDAPQFPGLVNATAKQFTVNEFSADKGYLSADNIDAVFAVGGTPYIAFKSNSSGAVGGLFQKMFHYYAANREEYMAHYHKRSNVESVMSMVKAKFGDAVRSKNEAAMKNEALCKIMAHNICCLIMSQVELGIEPVFWGGDGSTPKAAGKPDAPPAAAGGAVIESVVVREPEPVSVVEPAQEPVRRVVYACCGA